MSDVRHQTKDRVFLARPHVKASLRDGLMRKAIIKSQILRQKKNQNAWTISNIKNHGLFFERPEISVWFFAILGIWSFSRSLQSTLFHNPGQRINWKSCVWSGIKVLVLRPSLYEEKYPAYGRHWIFQRVQIVAPMRRIENGLKWLKTSLRNKPAAKAAGADPSQRSSTNRQNPPLQ